MSICKGHIYIITCCVNPKIYYIGSTYDKLKQRWTNHKTHYKNKRQDISIFEYFDKYGLEKFSIHLLKSYDVYRVNHNDHKHLQAYEQLWINKLKGCCNKRAAFQPLKKKQKKEYYEVNKEYYKQYRKEYRENNRDKIKEYYEVNKEKRKQYQKEYDEINKEQRNKKMKEYYEVNKEKRKQYKKEYDEINKEKIKQRNKAYYEKKKLNN